jgi:hypothetical protein
MKTNYSVQHAYSGINPRLGTIVKETKLFGSQTQRIAGVSRVSRISISVCIWPLFKQELLLETENSAYHG